MNTIVKFVAVFVMLFIFLPLQNICAQKERVSAVDRSLAQLTVEEKIALLVGAQEILADTALNEEKQRKVTGAWAYTHANAKLKIPSVSFADVRSGLYFNPESSVSGNGAGVTRFPVASVLAASWDKSLLYEVGAAIGKEASALGVDVVTAPAANVVRNPLSGRNGEYFSEDPVLVARLASAMAKGLQSQGVQVCLKYWFIDHQESNRTNVNVLVSQRTLMEIYLKTFEKVVREVRPWGIMAAYPQVNGVYQTENADLLTGTLRDQWHYDGVVVTDRYAGHDPVAQLLAGTDFLLPGSRAQYDALLEAYRSGKITEEQVNRAARRLLSAIMKTPSYSRLKAAKPDMSAHAKLAYKAAVESIVLLKNVGEGLPLDTHFKKVGCYGVSAYHEVQYGPGMQGTVSSSLAQEFLKAGFIPEPVVTNSYVSYLKSFFPVEKKTEAPAASAKGKTGAPAAKQEGKGAPVPQKKLSVAEAMAKDLQQIAAYPYHELPQELLPSKSTLQQHVKYAQFAVVSIGRMATEGKDRSVENGYRLSETEISLIREVCAAYHKWGKKVFVVLQVEGMVDLTDWQEYPDAILYCGHAGQGGASALVDLLVGKACPSGKLTAVWPKQYKDIPSSQNFPENYAGKPRVPKVGNDYPATGYMFVDEVTYAENCRIGYRYFDEHQDMVQYPFGFGLSYTSFAYDKLNVERKADSVIVQLRVTNTGKMAGKETVQLYVSPQRKNLRMERPLKEMCDFAKTRLLEPEESQTVTMRFAIRDLASYDESVSSWILPKGNYTLKIGSSANDIRNQWPLQIMEQRMYPKN